MSDNKHQEISEKFLNYAKKAGLFDYGPFKGSMIIMPYAYSMWEKSQEALDADIKRLGCKNIYFPCLIPENLLSKEKEHVEGFSPELAVVTHGGGEKLEENLAVRPTSETLMYSYFSKWINSWRDLPFKVNQWVNVIRWELRPFPFLRTSEFLWQEAHTVHSSSLEAEQEVMKALEMYQKFFREVLAIPVMIGKKTEREKFAGALYSMSCEALLLDGNALQIATAHNLGQNFSKAFDVVFQSREKKNEYAWQTSWGVSTRALGGMFLSHMDDKGLVIPPRVAPVQVQIIPVAADKDPQVTKIAQWINKTLKDKGVRSEFDERDKSVGWKFNDAELKGIPIRLEVGPKEVKSKEAAIVRRDTSDKTFLSLEELASEIPELLEAIQGNMLQKAEKFFRGNMKDISDYQRFKEVVGNERGFIRADWCGSSECEKKIKEETKATTRCLPFGNEKEVKGKCIRCGKEAKHRPVWARAY